jgi:hypothetical protein
MMMNAARLKDSGQPFIQVKISQRDLDCSTVLLIASKVAFGMFVRLSRHINQHMRQIGTLCEADLSCIRQTGALCESDCESDRGVM